MSVIYNLGITIYPPPGSNDTSGLDGSFVGEVFQTNDVDDGAYVVDDAAGVTKGEKVLKVDDGAGVADKEI